MEKIINLLKHKAVLIPLLILLVFGALFLYVNLNDDEEDNTQFDLNTKFPLEDYLFKNSGNRQTDSDTNEEIQKKLQAIQEEAQRLSQEREKLEKLKGEDGKTYYRDKDGNIVDENGNIVQPNIKLMLVDNEDLKGTKSNKEKSSSNAKGTQGGGERGERINYGNIDFNNLSKQDKARLSLLAKRFSHGNDNAIGEDFGNEDSKIPKEIEYGVDKFENLDKKDDASNENKLYRTITADKMIPTTLITPISSQIGGSKIVAQVESDIYANMGRAVLIPKGSRVIGYYNNDNKIGEYRLQVIWTRIITPFGVNILLTEAKGADVKGYAGLIGTVHNKYWERYGLPLSLSTLSNGLLIGITSALNSKNNSNNNSLLQNYLQTQMLQNTGNDVSNIIAQILREQIRIKPIITIKEGSRVFISPNVDIFFPKPKNGEVIAKFFKEYKPTLDEGEISDDENEF